jgi:PAS domain S-box-containing protein
MTNKSLLKILFVEDLPSDAELAVMELRKEGLRFEHMRVDTRDGFIKALQDFKPDIVISDYMMPSYNGMQALKDAHEFDPSLPFILCTGSMNEETAVECIKAGATDYIIKEHLTRLPFAVKEALEQHRIQIEKRAAELLLKESEEKLQSIFSAAPVGIGLLVNQIFMEINDTFCKMTGYNRKELIGKNAEIIYATDEQNESAGIVIYRHIAEKGSGSVETRLKCKDGRIINTFLSSSPLDKNDLSKGVTFCVMDITERKQAEEALLESEGKFKAIFQNSNDAIMLLNKNGFFDCNPQTLELFKINTKEEFIKFHPAELSPPFQPDGKNSFEASQEYINIANQEGHKRFDWTHRRTDGEDFYAEVLLSAFDLGGERVLQATARDITERKCAEETIIHERLLLRTLIDNLPDHIYVKDSDGRKLISNIADFKDLGLKNEQQVIGKTDLELFPGQTGQRGYDDDMEVITLDIRIIGREEDFIDSMGRKRWSLTTKIPLHDKNSKITGLVGIGHDITERKKAEEELIKAKDRAEESDRLKTAFLHNISHEIRTPMNAIVGFSALLGDPDNDLKTRESYIEIIMQSSNHLLAIISDIVDISNIEANLVRIARNDININSSLRSICNQFLVKAEEKKIKLICETVLSDSDALLITDSTKFTQIISNLINNALKFTDEGSVEVVLKIVNRFLQFSVSDTGIGIPNEYHARIFERFYQVQNSDSRLYEGTGLGLAISKAYVELMGGKIWLSSVPGNGATFCFTIPYEKQVVETPAVHEKRGSEDFVFPEKKTILVAEDIDSNFKLIKYFFKGTDTIIIRAKNGKEAVEKIFIEKNIDLILMDIKMPVMDGYTAVKLIRETNTSIPIIAQTAYIDDREQAIEYGCNGFISKPFDKKGLLKVLSEFI